MVLLVCWDFSVSLCLGVLVALFLAWLLAMVSSWGVLVAALGWLSREDKVTIEEVEGDLLVNLIKY